MTNLSPAAKAVLDAADSTFDQAGTTRQGIAAALRAAADQVVPAEVIWASDDALVVGQDIRQQLLAIAAELEGEN